MSRISPVLNELIGIEDPDALMVEILDVLSCLLYTSDAADES